MDICQESAGASCRGLSEEHALANAEARHGARRGLLAFVAVAALGINLLDNQDLEALGDMTAKLKRWEFMLTIAPVPVTGGTGFPVNAIAMF